MTNRVITLTKSRRPIERFVGPTYAYEYTGDYVDDGSVEFMTKLHGSELNIPEIYTNNGYRIFKTNRPAQSVMFRQLASFIGGDHDYIHDELANNFEGSNIDHIINRIAPSLREKLTERGLLIDHRFGIGMSLKRLRLQGLSLDEFFSDCRKEPIIAPSFRIFLSQTNTGIKGDEEKDYKIT